jgi:hypothetical protein
MISTVKPLDTAEIAQPAMTTPRATSMTARWRGPSASRPITGVARAPASRVMVRIHSPGTQRYAVGPRGLAVVATVVSPLVIR